MSSASPERTRPGSAPSEAEEEVARGEGVTTARWPAEWEPHRATWLSWPHNRETWPGSLEAAEEALTEAIAALLPGEIVRIVGGDAVRARARGRLADAGIEPTAVDWVACPTHDAWMRDHGAIFVTQRGNLAALDFGFDNWGKKYPGWELDDAVPGAMASHLSCRRVARPFVLEGGSIDGDGLGTVLTTESCLLHPNRRGGTPDARAWCERELAESLGGVRTIWLPGGIAGDDTDGHIDDVARFVAPGRVAAVRAPGGHPDSPMLEANWERLRRARDARGERLELAALPHPPPLFADGARLPASYANFYLANGVVLVPVFGAPSDESALRVLEDLLPDRRVVPIRCEGLVIGLGAIHCCTKEEPAPPKARARGGPTPG